VDGVDVLVLDQLVEARVALRDAERVADPVEVLPIPLADRGHLGVGVSLVDRDELSPEPETDNRDADALGHG
jgi:hypothetical protein